MLSRSKNYLRLRASGRNYDIMFSFINVLMFTLYMFNERECVYFLFLNVLVIIKNISKENLLVCIVVHQEDLTTFIRWMNIRIICQNIWFDCMQHNSRDFMRNSQQSIWWVISRKMSINTMFFVCFITMNSKDVEKNWIRKTYDETFVKIFHFNVIELIKKLVYLFYTKLYCLHLL